MFNLLKKSARQYPGEVPPPKPVVLDINVSLGKKVGTYDVEQLTTIAVKLELPVNSDAPVEAIRDAVEQNLAHALSPINAVIDLDPRLTDGAYARSLKEETA